MIPISHQPYTLERLPDLPVVLVHPEPGRTVGDGIRAGMSDLVRLLDAADEPLFVVVDLREVLVDVEEVIQAADRSARGRSPIMHHRNVRETLFVSTHLLVRLAVKGMTTEAFGCARARYFDTCDEALGYCCAQLDGRRG